MSQPSAESKAHVLPDPHYIEAVRTQHLHRSLPTHGIGDVKTKDHLENIILPALNRSSASPHYYGFVTGGSTPAATFADNMVTAADQNVSVHLPSDSIAADVEDRALRMVCELTDLDPNQWSHRTFTTGATASNVVGLACGREYVVRVAAEQRGESASVADDGLLFAMKKAGLEGVQILTTIPHSSLRKAAALVGLGSSKDAVINCGRADEPLRFDLDLLKERLQRGKYASIVAISSGEVNTGLFATDAAEMQKIRKLGDRYGAWIHVDAAFGLLARVLHDAPEYAVLKAGVAGLELADSITGDAHKLINVPYDCGIFLSKHLDTGINTFKNPDAPYLSTGNAPDQIPSPLNIGIENSRRFRALPVYATLLSLGRDGYREMLERQIDLARRLARSFVDCEHLELLPLPVDSDISVDESLPSIFMIVLWRFKDLEMNKQLPAFVKHLNGTRKFFISGTQYEGQPAARFAIANWQVDPSRDANMVEKVMREELDGFLKEHARA